MKKRQDKRRDTVLKLTAGISRRYGCTRAWSWSWSWGFPSAVEIQTA